MNTYLIKKYNQYYLCGNCRMKQPELHETCWFCGFFFTNYEEEVIRNYEEKERMKDE